RPSTANPSSFSTALHPRSMPIAPPAKATYPITRPSPFTARRGRTTTLPFRATPFHPRRPIPLPLPLLQFSSGCGGLGVLRQPASAHSLYLPVQLEYPAGGGTKHNIRAQLCGQQFERSYVAGGYQPVRSEYGDRSQPCPNSERAAG